MIYELLIFNQNKIFKKIVFLNINKSYLEELEIKVINKINNLSIQKYEKLDFILLDDYKCVLEKNKKNLLLCIICKKNIINKKIFELFKNMEPLIKKKKYNEIEFIFENFNNISNFKNSNLKLNDEINKVSNNKKKNDLKNSICVLILFSFVFTLVWTIIIIQFIN